MKYQHILVGLDGSKQAEEAFKVGCSLAQALSAKLYLVWIVNRDRGMDSSFGVNEDFYQDQHHQLTARIKPYLTRAQALKLDVTAQVPIGNIKTILARDYPKEHQIDLIIVGNTGLNAVTRMLQGSHSEYVIKNAPCDVLVVKAPKATK